MEGNLGIGFAVFAGLLLGVALVTAVLHYFVALTSAPSARAAWTAGISYFIVTAAGEMMIPVEYWWAPPLATMPAALIGFWWWRDDFQRGWLDDSVVVPEGVELANKDWRIGLLLVGSMVGYFLIRLFFRALSKGLI